MVKLVRRLPAPDRYAGIRAPLPGRARRTRPSDPAHDWIEFGKVAMWTAPRHHNHRIAELISTVRMPSVRLD
jgi:hypothetical protein